MTERPETTPEILPPEPRNPSPEPKRRNWKTPALVAGALVVGVSGGLATSAMSQGAPFGPAGYGPFGGLREAIAPAVIDTMIDRGIRHLAIEIDANQDQQTKLIAIAQSAAKDLLPIRQQFQASHDQARALLVQPNLDAAAIENFRSQQMALADTASKRIAQAVEEASAVLTPEQRVKIASRLPEAMGRGGFGRPGGFQGPWYRG